MATLPPKAGGGAGTAIDGVEARTAFSDDQNLDRADNALGGSPTTLTRERAEAEPTGAESSKAEEIRVLYPKLSGRRRRRRRQKKSSDSSAPLSTTPATEVKSASSPHAQSVADDEEEAAAEKYDRNPLYVDLHVAIRDRDAATVAEVVAKITNVNVPTLPDYQSPAHVAASTGQVDVLQILSKHRSFEPDLRTRDAGLTPLLLAVSHGHGDAALLLLQKNASVEQAANDGTTPLAMACLVNETEVAEILLEHQADPNVARNSGSAPIHFAALHNNARILEKLLEAKAMPSLENEQHLTALKIAAVQGSMSFAKVLVQHQANARFAADGNDDIDSQGELQDGSPTTAEALEQTGNANSVLRNASDDDDDKGRNSADDESDSLDYASDAGFPEEDELKNDSLDADQEGIEQEAELLAEVEPRLQDELCDGSKTAQISMVLTALVAVLVVLVAVLIAAWTKQGDQIAQLRQQIARLKADPTCSARPPPLK